MGQILESQPIILTPLKALEEMRNPSEKNLDSATEATVC